MRRNYSSGSIGIKGARQRKLSVLRAIFQIAESQTAKFDAMHVGIRFGCWREVIPRADLFCIDCTILNFAKQLYEAVSSRKSRPAAKAGGCVKTPRNI